MESTQRTGPLAKFRVLELGSTVAGPFCGRLFADFGAEVIKVEPLEGDAIRSIGSRVDGKSLYASSIFRNKSLIALDLRSVDGQQLVKKMVAKCDVVIENFRPGALEKWGLGYEDLSRVNPKLVMTRISGYGQSGPYSKRPGYGIICEAVGGLRHLVGDPDRPPARVAISLTDYVTGLYAFSGAVMALLDRETSGVGQCVDAALYESAFSLMEQHIAAYEKLGIVAKRLGPSTGSAPNNLYPTRDNQLVHIAANSSGTFKRLLGAMGKPHLAEDERFKSAVARAGNREALDAIVGEWTRTWMVEDIERVLDDVDVPASRIFTLPDIFKDPHYRAREAIVHACDEDLGSIAMASIVPKLTRTPGKIRHAGRRLGADTEDVLIRLAGLTAQEVSRLETKGVLSRGQDKRKS